MSIHIDDQALKIAASDMLALRTRNKNLKDKLAQMYQDLTSALDTPAGHAVEWTGKDVLLKPLEDMEKVLEHVSDTLNVIIGQDTRQGGEPRGTYYDKLFDEYEELDRILRTKSTN